MLYALSASSLRLSIQLAKRLVGQGKVGALSFQHRIHECRQFSEMLSATPARQRSRLSQSRPPSNARSQATTRTIEIPELPEYEPPEAPLTAECHRKIATLLRSQHLHRVQTHLRHATEKLTDTAGDVNERLFDARVRYERAKQLRRGASDDVEEDHESDNEEDTRITEQEHKVQDVTGRLEEKMRQMIDSEARLQSLLDSVAKIEREEGEAQVAALGVRETRLQRQRQRRLNRAEDEDEDEDGDDERDETYEGTPEREARERNIQNPPSRRLDDSLENGVGKWNELSLTERYVEIVRGTLLTGSLLMDLLQVRQPQLLHWFLPHCTRLQIPWGRGAAPAALLYMVRASGRYKCASAGVYSWQSRTTGPW